MPIPLGILAVAGAGAGAAGSFDLLETTLISTNTASVTFSGLGSYTDYKHLQLRITARTDRAATNDDLLVQFNSDTGTNYTTHYLNGTGSVVEFFADTAINGIRTRVTGANATANIFSPVVADILDFSSSSKNTTVRILNHDGGNDDIRLLSGLWINTSAVTSITLDQRLGTNFVSGSRFSLYGVK